MHTEVRSLFGLQLILSDSLSQQVIATPSVSTTYMLIAIDSCGADTTYFDVNIPNDTFNQTSSDSVICKEDSLTLFASGGITYRWSGTNIINIDSASPIISPTQSTTYYVDITTPNGCIYTDSVYIDVDISASKYNSPRHIVNLCFGDSVLVAPSNVESAIWSPLINPYDTIGNNIWISSDSNMIFT